MIADSLTLADPVNRLEEHFLENPLPPPAWVKLIHHFAPGCYARELRRPKGTFIIGHAHKTSHLNFLMKGSLSVYMEGKIKRITAPAIFVSEAGIRKMTYAHQDSTLVTVHPTEETDMDRLEEELIEKSDAYTQHELKDFRTRLGITR